MPKVLILSACAYTGPVVQMRERNADWSCSLGFVLTCRRLSCSQGSAECLVFKGNRKQTKGEHRGKMKEK